MSRRALLISIFTHLFILFPFKSREPVKKIKVSKQEETVTFKVKLKSKETKVSVKKGPGRISFSDLRPVKPGGSLSQFKASTSEDIGYGKSSKIFNLIEKNLVYPSELIENKVQGNVDVDIYINSKGEYIERKTRIKSPSPYLRVAAARTLRKAFKERVSLSIEKMSKFKLKLKFLLSTSRTPLSESGILDEYFYFFRQAYGISTNADKVHHVINKTLIHSLNLWSFKEYLPLSDKEQVKKMWRLSNYKSDPFF